jgi:polysaccharide biosynthesis transport protein
MADTRKHAAADDAEGGLTVLDIWHALRRNRWLVAGVTLLVTVLGAVFTWLQDPVYASESSLLIEEKRPGIALMADLNPLMGGGGDGIETDIKVLQSRRIAEAAVDSLDLHVQLVAPAVPRSQLLEVIDAPRTTRAAHYVFTRQEDGSYRAPVRGRPDVVLRVGQPGQLGPVTVRLTPRVARTAPEEIEVGVARFVDAVALLRKYLRVGRDSREVTLVNVQYQSKDREMAAQVPNVIANRFIEHKTGNELSESSGMVSFLREQVGSYEEQLRTAEADLREYRESANVVSPVDEATEQVRRLAQRTAERDAKRAERDALSELLTRITAAPADPSGRSPYRQLASFPVFLSNPLVQNLLQSVTELENQRASLLIGRTEANRDVQGIEVRVGEIEQQLYRTARGYLESLDTELRSMDADLSRFGTQMATIPSRELEFARRRRNAQLLEELYTLLQTRLKEAEITNAVLPNNIRVLDPALVPDRPVSPIPMRNLVLAGAFGLLLGVGLAMGLEALDTKVRTEEDAASVAGGVPVLGAIPRIRLKGATGDGMSERLVTQRDPRSPVSEAYRALRTNLAFAAIDGAPQVTVVTSAMPGDGKSTSAANLAVTLAQQGTPTLLVDADLRKGLLHHVLGARKEPGLTHVLLGRATLDEAVQLLPMGDGTPLAFLPAGIFPPNPAELLGAPRMRELMKELRERFAVIVLDAPPLNHVTDAAVLGSMADSTLLVARSGATEKEALRHAANRLELLRAPVGGLVLNDLETGRAGYGYYGMEEEKPSGRRNGRKR